MLTPVRTSPPAATPVSLTEAKAQCRAADFTDDDVLITSFLEAATDHLDGYSGILGRALVTQTWRQDFPEFCDCLRLPLLPVASITSITYYDADNAQQTLATSIYSLFADARGAYAGLKPDQSWPSNYGRPDAVSVTFIAGQPAADVPASIRHAILLLVSSWYENREAVVTGTIVAPLPFAVDALLSKYRRVGV